MRADLEEMLLREVPKIRALLETLVEAKHLAAWKQKFDEDIKQINENMK